jgi:tetratricopeptide (TPR) repeat protein
LGEAVDVRPTREPFAIPVPKSFAGPEFEELLAERPRSSNGFRKAALAGSVVSVLALGVGSVEWMHNKSVSAHSSVPVAKPAVAPTGADALDTKKLTDQSELLDQARSFSQKREYSKAVDIYRTILKSDPSNTEVKRLLASALFRQEKIDESVKVLNSIAEDKSSGAQQETPQQ